MGIFYMIRWNSWQRKAGIDDAGSSFGAERSWELRSLVFCYRTIVVALAVLAVAHEAVKLFLILGAA